MTERFEFFISLSFRSSHRVHLDCDMVVTSTWIPKLQSIYKIIEFNMNVNKFRSGIALLFIVFIAAYIVTGIEKASILTTAGFKEQLPDKYRKTRKGPDSRPSEWSWLQRTYPHGTADVTAHLDAIQQARDLRTDRKTESGSSTAYMSDIRWQFAGPLNIGGRISDIEYNPLYPNIVYAGASTGGVFKSYDGGLTWSPIFDDQAALSVGDIAVDPVNPDIVYVGTGEANGGHNNFPGAGIYKSTDAGVHWEMIGLERTASVGRIVIDPSNTDRIFVAAVGSYFGPDPDRGVYLSEDGGQTWNKSLFISDSTGAIDIVINPQNPDVLHAAMWERVRRPTSSHLFGPTSGIYRSNDGGMTWIRLNSSNGLPGNDPLIGRIGLALCQSQPDILYALYTDYSSGRGYSYRNCYRSTDNGLNWSLVDPLRRMASGFSSFSWYFGNIRVHPEKPNTVYAMDVAFMRSDDGGDTWPRIYGYGGYPNLHVDHHALAFHPFHPDTVINGNDGGINISHDNGNNWTKVGLLPVTQFYEITMDQSNPQRLYGGTQDNGTMRTLTGALDDWEIIFGGDGFFVLVDPRDPNVIYAESQNGYLGKSINGGYSFVLALSGIDQSEPTNWSTPVIMDPNDSDVLYYGTDRVYRSTNGAASWQPISPDLTKQLPDNRLGTVTTIAVAPGNSNVIYAGTDDGNVWVTDDYGEEWRDITGDLPLRWVTRVAVDPTDASTAYVTFSGLKWKSAQPHVFSTQNMGTDWHDISSNLPDAPVNTILVDPVYSNLLYLGNDVGCFYSSDHGAYWRPLGTGIPIVPVYSMAIHNTLRILAIGTHGRSMYVANLDQLVPVEQSSFTISLSNDGVSLNWRTESETNNLGFSVERKSGQLDFQEIGFVRGAGTTAVPQDYHFLDRGLPSGDHYYRLKQVDYDGSSQYSQILHVRISAPAQDRLHQNYPNPFNASTTISYAVREKGPVRIGVFNTGGALVRMIVNQTKEAGSYRAAWDGKDSNGNDVSSGVYFVRMNTLNYLNIKRMIIIK